MKALLALMDLERRWAISDRDPIRHWHRGRVVLLGDAAHPTLQSLAQGACMAIEDGVCLAELIDAARGDFAAAFRRYEAARVVRTARVQLDSRVLWEFYHAAGIAREVRALTVADWTEAHMFELPGLALRRRFRRQQSALVRDSRRLAKSRFYWA